MPSPTPGPWRVSSFDDHLIVGAARHPSTPDRHGLPVVPAIARVVTRMDSAANARLIAAAPALLAACEDLIASAVARADPHLMTQLVNAISMARGQPAQATPRFAVTAARNDVRSQPPDAHLEDEYEGRTEVGDSAEGSP